MTTPSVPALKPRRKVVLGSSEMHVEKRADGTMIAQHPQALGAYPAKATEWLDKWAKEAPDRVFLAQRDGTGPWRTITYAQAHASVRAIAAALLTRNLSPKRPVVSLTGNDLGQALITFAAQYIGVPFAPISPAYATMSQDFGKLRHVFQLLEPGMVYATTAAPLTRALDAVMPPDGELVVAAKSDIARPQTLLTDLITTPVTAAVDAAHAKVGPDTIAKILFTSGSTGMPKGVINTQRMMCSNQVMFAAVSPYMTQQPPVLVDWLPWSHTFGGNHNVNLALSGGGSLYIDEGRPMPGGIEQTVRNLKEIAPTVYFNVPRGYEALLPYLQTDAALAKNFFSRLQAIQYAGASLSQPIWEGFEDIAIKTTGERIFMMSGLGSTETAPGAITVTKPIDRAGIVGVPMPGVIVKLVPNSGKLEARLKGPNITPGYWKNPEQTAAAFDEEGFYKLGDALKFANEADYSDGFRFDGRVAEDFKLSSGTWVSVGPLRADLIQHFAPLIRDAVIAGADKPSLAALLIPELEPARALAGLSSTAPAAEVFAHPAVVAKFSSLLASHAGRNTGSSTLIPRIVLLHEPLSIDVGEITDKGSVNQRMVLTHRAALVDDLYTPAPSMRVILLPKKA
jgi:feruloyl-CoA synthase